MANIELDGANKKIKVDSGDLTLDVPGDIVLDADGGDLVFADGGTNLLKVTNSSSDVVVQPQVDAKDIKFNQYDGRTLLDINDGGFVGIANGATGPGQLRLYEDTDNGTNYSAFQVGTQSGDITYTLPTADGSNGHFLSTNGSGTLSWGAAAFSVSDITGATALGETPADTDEFIISDNGTLKRVDFSHLKVTPFYSSTYFDVTMSADQSVSASTTTKVDYDTEVSDLGSNFDTSTQKYTAPSAGTYIFNCGVHVASGADSQLKVSEMRFRSTPSGGSDTDFIVSSEDNEGSRHRRNSHKATFMRVMAANEVIFVLAFGNVTSGSPQFLYESGNKYNYFQGYRIA